MAVGVVTRGDKVVSDRDMCLVGVAADERLVSPGMNARPVGVITIAPAAPGTARTAPAQAEVGDM